MPTYEKLLDKSNGLCYTAKPIVTARAEHGAHNLLTTGSPSRSPGPPLPLKSFLPLTAKRVSKTLFDAFWNQIMFLLFSSTYTPGASELKSPVFSALPAILKC